MKMINDMLSTHPTFNQKKSEELTSCIQSCLTCASVCTICADACLSEDNSDDLIECIKNNLLCASICKSTATCLSYQVETSGALQSLIESCKKICEVCAKECSQHGEKMKHCAICADCCRHCYESCEKLMRA